MSVIKRLALLLVVVLATGTLAAGVLWRRVHAPYRGYSSAEQFVDLPAGIGTRAIGDRLVDAGVIRDLVTYRVALWLTGRARKLKAGEYRFDWAITPLDAIAKIARGDVYVISVTFPEGLTIAEMARIFEAHGFGPASAFARAAGDTTLIGSIDPTARDLEGYLFPRTYALPRHTDGPQLVRMMVDQFERVLTPDFRRAAAARGLTLHQVVTLASIVEKETAQPDERALVASVYENRFRIGMGLQCDPTVVYALLREGRYTGNLRRDDLLYDSPYNTYRYTGLPPGPIAAPGKPSLDAVVYPADSAFLYFVSRNDGTHAFARTLDEHNRNVRTFQVEYFRERRVRAGTASR